MTIKDEILDEIQRTDEAFSAALALPGPNDRIHGAVDAHEKLAQLKVLAEQNGVLDDIKEPLVAVLKRVKKEGFRLD